MSIVVWSYQYKSGNINYDNSDATWHTLLTIQAYQETPISVHKFLPIVSLGGEDNKWISWGATIPDKNGNYYYTSFSPAGYVVPYVFFKIFQLPIVEDSLHVFNLVLLIMSSMLWGYFLVNIFLRYNLSLWGAFWGVLLYTTIPEIAHCFGVVYWHQSLMQVLLLIQLIAYEKYRNSNNKNIYKIFVLLCVINPYVEWTGYVANVGYVLLVSYDSKCRKMIWRKGKDVVIASILAFVLFSIHYLSVVDFTPYIKALISRFMARNVVSSASILHLCRGYIDSFSLLWVPMVAISFYLISESIRNKKSLIDNIKYYFSIPGYIYFILFFYSIENIIMKQHAIAYTFDRMKVSFILIMIVCDFIVTNIKNVKSSIRLLICLGMIACCLGNVFIYHQSERIWSAEYLVHNKELADRLMEYDGKCVYGTDICVRGYINMLFKHGVYENISKKDLIDLSRKKGKRYAAYIRWQNNEGSWALPSLKMIEVIDVKNLNVDTID